MVDECSIHDHYSLQAHGSGYVEDIEMLATVAGVALAFQVGISAPPSDGGSIQQVQFRGGPGALVRAGLTSTSQTGVAIPTNIRRPASTTGQYPTTTIDLTDVAIQGTRRRTITDASLAPMAVRRREAR
jgi:hypothetical protein